MTTIRRKRIYYAPGIITLAILPLVFTYDVKREIKARTLTAIPIYIPSRDFLQKNAEWYPKFKGHFPPRRNYFDVQLTGDNQMDNFKLATAQLRVREILSRNDSLNGLHFKFGDSSQYGTFIKAIDVLRIEDAKTYVVLDNSLWFYHLPPDTSMKPSGYSCILCNDLIAVKATQSWWTKTFKQARLVWNNSWQLILGFALFVSVTILLRLWGNGR